MQVFKFGMFFISAADRKPATRLALFLGAVVLVSVPAAWAAADTTTTMTLTSAGGPVTSVGSHTVITLTASVKSGSTPVTVGQVKFCDAAAAFCEDSHLLGIQQLTPAGIATFKFVPGIGSHSYKAVFAGTHVAASSSANPQSLTVTGAFATRTTISSTGSAGSYTLSSTVTSIGPPLPPSGLVFFQDRSDGAAVLGQGQLGLATHGQTNWKDFYPSPFEPARIAVGDFNGDGWPDIATIVYNVPEIVVLMNHGDGRYSKVTSTIVGKPADIIAGDFNGDGKLDVALTAGATNRDQTEILILPGQGDGTFGAGVSTPLAGYVRNFAAADISGDGRLDLVVSTYQNDYLSLLAGKGDGSFDVTQGPTAGSSAAIEVGDFNGDGKADLLVSEFSAGVLAILINNGDGTFSAGPSWLSTFFLYTPPAIADFNGDGKSDIAGTSGNSQVLVLESNSDGTFTQVSVPRLVPSESLQHGVTSVAADFNGDGYPDVAVYVDVEQDALAGSPYVLLGSANGSFTWAPNASPSRGVSEFYQTAAADMDGDGAPDLVIHGSNASVVTVLSNQWIQTASANSSGKAPTGAGTHQVVARYQGSDDFVTSVSKPLALTGLTSPAPVATLSTTLLQFGERALGVPSNAHTAVLTNNGTAPLVIGSSFLKPVTGYSVPFATSNNCPASLAVGASCKIRFRFYPTQEGYRVSRFFLDDNAANSAQAITLTGTGVARP